MSSKRHKKLGEFLSTAMSGNNIFSSALYVSGIAVLFAGTYAPIALLLVAGVLFFYRTVYREVVEALPVNGGAYNALLNSTVKPAAAIAGVMTILSYMATAVISAKTAVEYLGSFIMRLPSVAADATAVAIVRALTMPAIIALLLVCAILVIGGVRDSAKVAGVIFVLHILVLVGFIVAGFFLGGHSHFAENTAMTAALVGKNGGLAATIFFAFSASLLGVSGFESAANFVEEQKPGVFRKILRNLTVGVAMLNPLIALVILRLLPLSRIIATKDFVLTEAASSIGGLAFLGVIAVDAFLVLTGAVLMSYVGVSGLMERMAQDECLPSFLASKKGSGTNAVAAFFFLCVSILLFTGGDLLSLAGVYTVSFLGVMSLFAIGNLVLRKTRPELKRPYRAPLIYVLLGLAATLGGIFGNIAVSPRNAVSFLVYFIPAVTLTMAIIHKREAYAALKKIFRAFPLIADAFERRYRRATDARVFAFMRDPGHLYPILDYVNKNEAGHNVTIVHCKDTLSRDETSHRGEMRRLIPELQRAGVFPHLRIDFAYVPSAFSPQTIRDFSKKHEVPMSRIFIGSIHEYRDFDYADFGGVRIVL